MGFGATPNAAIMMNKARYVTTYFDQDVRVGFTEVHDE